MDTLIRTIERLTDQHRHHGVVRRSCRWCSRPATRCFARYAFGAPTIWAYEIGYMLTGSHFLLGMAYTLRGGAHIRIDIFSGKFSPRTRALIDLCAYAVVLPLLIWLSYALFQHLATGYLRSERSGQSAMNLPVWPFRVVFLVAFTLLALQVLAEVVKTVRAMRDRGAGRWTTCRS